MTGLLQRGPLDLHNLEIELSGTACILFRFRMN